MYSVYKQRKRESTLQIVGLNTQKSVLEAEKQLWDWFNAVCPGAVEKIEAVPEFSSAYPVYLQLKKYQNMLHFYRLYEQNTQKTAYMRVKICQKVAAIPYLENEEKTLLEKLQNYYFSGLEHTCGAAFVTFHSQSALLQVKNAHKNSPFGVFFELHEACSPLDVNWENVNSTPMKGKLNRFALTVVFAVVFLVILTPTNFTFLLTHLYKHSVSIGADVLESYLPTILLFLYQQVFLPYTMDCLVSRERHVSKSEATASNMIKMLVFNSFYVFFLQFFGMQFITLLRNALQSDMTTWVQTISNSLTSTGQFFTIYLLQLTFWGNGLDLLQPLRLIQVKLAEYRAISQEHYVAAYTVNYI